MALKTHEVLLAAGTVVSPATTLAQIRDSGSVGVLVTTDQSVRFTTDGLTNPVVSASTVGTLLTSSDSVSLTVEEFINSKWLDVSTDARIQFMFLGASRGRS